MPRSQSLLSVVRKNLLLRDDPFQPLSGFRRGRPPVPIPLTAPVGPAAMPTTANRPDDLARVSAALGQTGFSDLAPRANTPRIKSFDTRLDGGIRDFQRRHRLKVDGLMNPGGPTARTLSRVLAHPPLKNLSAEAVSANGRLVRHLMTTTEDGIVPDLMTSDFRANKASRAKTADFLSQLFNRAPDRARNLHAKANIQMSAKEKSQLDKLIVQARLADEEALVKPLATPPGDADDDKPDDPDVPDDPGQDDDPDDEPDDEPDEPEQPEPDKEKCKELIEALKKAEADLRGAQSFHDGAQMAVNEKTNEVKQKRAAYEQAFKAFAAETGIALWDIYKGRIPRGVPLPSNVQRAKEAYETASRELKVLIDELHRAEDKLKQAQERVSELQKQIEAAGCSN
ncbi:MAG: hypothetical protein O3A85_08360 [Proteobacteria bacterium]|nr:hypothetical protein [Pseudomonadota bacterium]